MSSVPVPSKRRGSVLKSIEVDNRDLYPPTSRYKATKYFQRNIPGIGQFIEPETWNPPKITPSDKDLFTKILPGEEGRLDLVSLRVYKLDQLWWVIAYLNNMIDPIADATVGKVLRYAPFSVVATKILT